VAKESKSVQALRPIRLELRPPACRSGFPLTSVFSERQIHAPIDWLHSKYQNDIAQIWFTTLPKMKSSVLRSAVTVLLVLTTCFLTRHLDDARLKRRAETTDDWEDISHVILKLEPQGPVMASRAPSDQQIWWWHTPQILGSRGGHYKRIIENAQLN
jgi:hypothetical protein